MSTSDVQALPISTLKAILFRNHVNASMVVEKSELVSKVQGLIDDERAEREAHARREEEEEEERELREAMEQSRREHEEREAAAERERAEQHEQAEATTEEGSADHSSGTPPPQPPSPEPVRGKLSAKAQNLASHLERTGLCVICQDEEANIAIVDCGYVYIRLSGMMC